MLFILVFEAFFIWLQNALYRFAMSSVAVAVSLATTIILLMTANWMVTLIAALTLSNVLCTALMLFVIIGWRVGLNEAVCIIVASGMAVDCA